MTLMKLSTKVDIRIHSHIRIRLDIQSLCSEICNFTTNDHKLCKVFFFVHKCIKIKDLLYSLPWP